MARMRSEIRMKDSSTKSYELAHSRQETELLKRQLANQEARLSSQVPSVNQEVATLQAQVRQLKGEASELKAKESCRSQAPLALENNSIGHGGGVSSSSAIEGAGDERFAKLVQKIEDWKSDNVIVIKSLEESHNAEHERIRSELNDMEARKDKYKSYFNQLEVHLNEEEEACRAESEAFEKVRNEYNEQVKELSELENKSPTRVCRKKFEKAIIPPWPKVEKVQVWKSLVIQNVCVASGTIVKRGRIGSGLLWNPNLI